MGSELGKGGKVYSKHQLINNMIPIFHIFILKRKHSIFMLAHISQL